VHDYLGIDLETIWGIMQNEVRELRTAIEEMLDLSVDDEE
jgi:uncharacterized protein with HEPN domain